MADQNPTPAPAPVPAPAPSPQQISVIADPAIVVSEQAQATAAASVAESLRAIATSTDAELVSRWVDSQMSGTRSPTEMVTRARDTLAAFRKWYPA